MELTQTDYEDRRARVDDGTADDEDRRLVKHYEREGYTTSDSEQARNPFEVEQDGGGPDSGEGVDGAAERDYSTLTKRELVAELETRKDAAGDPLVFDRNARNEALIEQLRANDAGQDS